MGKKLFRVTCKGMHGGIGSDVAHGIAYVVANNSDEAYLKVRASLDKQNFGFQKEREMERVELLAEETNYPNCGYCLYA